VRRLSVAVAPGCAGCLDGLRRLRRWASFLGFAVEVVEGERAESQVRSTGRCPIVTAFDGRVLASGRLKGLGRRLFVERFRS
jgi:hypothetical protein